MVTCCKTVVWYHNQHIDTDTIYQSYSSFSSFTSMCVLYIVLYNFVMYVGSCIHHHSQDAKQSHHHQDASGSPFVTTPSFFLPLFKTVLFPGHHNEKKRRCYCILSEIITKMYFAVTEIHSSVFDDTLLLHCHFLFETSAEKLAFMCSQVDVTEIHL